MLSLTATHTHIPIAHRRFSRWSCALTCRPCFEFSSKKRGKDLKTVTVLRRYLGSRESREKFDSVWCCGCKQAEGDAELESEILEFMAKSEKPAMFPTKCELIQAGRMDLVEAIKSRGGWYSLGWDDENVEEGMDIDIGELRRRVEDCEESASLRQHWYDSVASSDEVYLNSGSLDSPQSTASTSFNGSLESRDDVDAGIDGILSRLEKQRNSDFGINIEGNVYKATTERKDEGEDGRFDTSFDVGGNGRLRHGIHHTGRSGGKSSPNIDQQTWRTWSNQQAGTQYTDFEAAEISFGENGVETDEGTHHDGIAETTGENMQDWYRHEDQNNSHIKTRLQHLESELNSALHSLRAKRAQFSSEEVTGSSNELQKLSDAIEFQENEFMSAQDRLRSIRAKLAVLEGKMALAVTDAKRLVEVKQKRIDDAQKALQFLRTTSIVWPNSASEVFLAGSFDGWTTQRKMEKSKTGIFSVSLKLYPGRYEIKFIVDGIWKVDPLRPVVNNNGYENNLLIVT